MPSHQINKTNMKTTTATTSKKPQYNSNTNYVEVMYKTLRRQENQLKQKLASNLQAQNYLRNVMNLERKLAEQSYNHQMNSSSTLNNGGRMMRMMMMQSNNARGDFIGQKRATMYTYPITSNNGNNNNTATTTTATTAATTNEQEMRKFSTRTHPMRQEQEQQQQQEQPHRFMPRAPPVMNNHHNQHDQEGQQAHEPQAPSSPPSTLPNYRYMRVPSSPTTMTSTTTTTTHMTPSQQATLPSRLTMPVKYDHFDVTITKPLTTDTSSNSHLSLTLNVKNKSNTDVRFCVTFTNAQGKSVCVWPIVSETFKDLCDFELLEGGKNVDIQLSTKLLPREYLEFEGDKPLTLSIILTSHTAMSSTISEVVHLQRQYHSMLRMRQQQQQQEDNSGNDDDDEQHQCNSCGRTAIIRKCLKTL